MILKVHQGDKIFVSGGSGGIGKAICRQLTEHDLVPIIGYHQNRGEAEQLAHELRGSAVPVNFANISGSSQTTPPLDWSGADLGGIILAASPPPQIAPFRKITIDEARLQYEVNVVGHLRLCQHLIDHVMKPNRRGVIVGILSEAMGDEKQKAAQHMGAYIVAKYGLLGLLRVLDAEYSWLRIETISPGYTETKMLDAFEPRFLEMMRAKQSNLRFDSPEDIARRIVNTLIAL